MCGLFRILFMNVLPIVEIQVKLVPIGTPGAGATRVLVDVVVARGWPPDVPIGRHLLLLLLLMLQVLLLVLLLEPLLLLLPQSAPRGRFRFGHEAALSVAVVPATRNSTI